MPSTRLTTALWIIALAVATSTGVAAADDSDWPGWLGPNRDGKSPDTGLLKTWPDGGPRLLWKIDYLGPGFSNVAVTGGTIYTTGHQDEKLVIFAMDLDGKLKWKTEADVAWTKNHVGSRATPMIDGDRLYLLSGHGTIGCYDSATGRKKWTRNTTEFGGRPGGWGYSESILIHENLAFVKPGGENFLVALNKQTGRTAWTSSGFNAGPEYSSCLLVNFEGQDIIVTGSKGGLVCFDADDGSLLWSNDWCAKNTANCPTPAYSDGYIFWSNGYGKGGICMKLKTVGGKVDADEVWTTTDFVCHHGGYIIKDGHIYGNHNRGWSCLELATGKVLWEEKAIGKGSLCYADEMLYLFGEKGGQAALATFSPDGLEVKGNVTVDGEGPSWAHPVVIGGRLYLRFGTNLYCFDVKSR